MTVVPLRSVGLCFAILAAICFCAGCATHDAAIQTVNSQVSSFEKKLATQQAQINDLSTSLDKRIEDHVAPVASDLKKLRTELILNRSQLEDFEDAVDKASTSNQAMLKALRLYLATQRTSLDAQQKKVDAIMKTLGTN